MGSFGSTASAGLCRTLIALMLPLDVDIESHPGALGVLRGPDLH